MTMKIELSVPAIRALQGSVAVYQAQIEPSQLLNFLGHDPRSRNWPKLQKSNKEIHRIYQTIQRTTHFNRVSALISYFRTRVCGDNKIPGAIPAISVGTETAPNFDPIPGCPVEIGKLRLDDKSLRIIFDGLGRTTALLDILEANAKALKEGQTELVTNIDAMTIPVTIYAPSSGRMGVTELAQLFYDFNVMRAPVTSKQARGKDSASPYTQVGRALAEVPELKRMLMRFTAAKRQRFALNEERMARIVRGVAEGIGVGAPVTQRSKAPNLTTKNVVEYTIKMQEFFAHFAKKMGSSFYDHSGVHVIQAGYNAIALILHTKSHGRFDLLSSTEIKLYAEAMASIDWSRSNTDWIGVVFAAREDGNGEHEITGVMGGSASSPANAYINERFTEYLVSKKAA